MFVFPKIFTIHSYNCFCIILEIPNKHMLLQKVKVHTIALKLSCMQLTQNSDPEHVPQTVLYVYFQLERHLQSHILNTCTSLLEYALAQIPSRQQCLPSVKASHKVDMILCCLLKYLTQQPTYLFAFLILHCYIQYNMTQHWKIINIINRVFVFAR